MEQSLSLGLDLHDRFTAPAKRLVSVGEKLTGSLSKTQKQLISIGRDRKVIRKFQDLEKALSKTDLQLQEARASAQKLGRPIKEAAQKGEKATKAQTAALERAQKKVKQLTDRFSEQKTRLAQHRSELKRAGHNTRNLADAQKRLGDQYARTKRQMENYAVQQAKLDRIDRRFNQRLQNAANVALVGAGMSSFGQRALQLFNRPNQSFRALEHGKGQLQGLGIEDTDTTVRRGQEIQREFAGIRAADFTGAAYDIKSGIETLSDTGVADVTEQAAITAKATKSQVGEMTSLFSTGFGIFKNIEFKELSDKAFADKLGASLTATVKTFDTTGTEMQQAIESMGAGLAISGVAMNEQLAALGMLQPTMSAGVAGTTLNAVERSAAVAQARFAAKGSSVQVLDNDGNMRGLADLLDAMQEEFGKAFTTETGFKIQQAFGSEEAVKFFKQLWGQGDDLRQYTKSIRDAAEGGAAFTRSIATAIDRNNADARQTLAMQRLEIVGQKLGKAMVPFIEMILPAVEAVGSWVEKLVDSGGLMPKVIIGTVGALGLFASVTGPLITGFASLTITAAWLKKSFDKLALSSSLAGGGGTAAGGRGRRRREGGKLRGRGFGAGKLLGAAGSALMLADAVSTLGDDSLTAGEKTESITTSGAGLAGAIGGAKLGAAIGTFIAPGIGTAIGGVLGGAIGGIAGSELASSAWSWFKNDAEAQKAGKEAITKARPPTDTVSAQALSPTAPLSAAAGTVVHDNSQASITITAPVADASNQENVAKLVAEQVEAKLRDHRRELAAERSGRLYDGR